MSGYYDLMYIGEKEMYEECQREILADFPDCLIQDASDFLHLYRFDVQHKETTHDEWFLWLFRHGWFESSLGYQFDSMNDPDSVKPLMRQVIEERKVTTE